MPSHNTYPLTSVSLTLVMGYLFTAAPAKHSCCSLSWMRGISSGPPLLTLNGCNRPCRSTPAPTHHAEVHQLPHTAQKHAGCYAPHKSMAERSYSTFKVRSNSCEEIPLIQDKEQQLCFAGAALKRYPMSKVRETQVRQVLREASEGRHTNHNHRKLVSLITLGPQLCLTQ